MSISLRKKPTKKNAEARRFRGGRSVPCLPGRIGQPLFCLIYCRELTPPAPANYFARRYFMPIFKQLRDFYPHECSGHPPANKTKRKRVFNSIFQHARIWAIRLKHVRVLPIREWPGNLNVGKITPHFKVLMFGDPEAAKWPPSKLHHDARPALDPAGSLDHLHMLTGRSESFEGVRQRVPGVHYLCGRFDPRPANKDFSFQFVS